MENRKEPEPFLSPPLHVKMMLSYYLAIAAYSFVATITSVPTLDFSYGNLWGVLGPLLMLFISLAVLLGLYRTVSRGKKALEICSTFLLIGLMAGYSVAIFARAMILDKWDLSSGSVLPIVIIVPMYFRLLQIFPTLPDRLWDKLPVWIRRR